MAAGGTSDFINKVKTSAKKGVVESIVSNVSDNKGNNSGDDTPGYTYEETPAVTSFTAKIRTQHEFARGTNPDNTKYKTYKDYVRGMLEKYEKDLTDNDIATISQKYGL